MKNKEFKKGDLVWSPLLGDGIVSDVIGNVNYCVSVVFGNHPNETFTPEGVNMKWHKYPTLFHRGEVTIQQNKFIRMSTDNMPVYESQMVYCIDINGRVFETKITSWNKEGNMYVVKENAEKAIIKRFTLPDWIDCCYFFLDKTKVMVCVVDMAFAINGNNWIKKFCETSQFDSCELEETTFDKLVVGDWFMINTPESTIVFGAYELVDFDGEMQMKCVRVNKSGKCCDIGVGVGAASKKYYKITPKQ